MKEIEKQLLEKNGLLDEVYGEKVNRLIRRRYSLTQELSLQRQKDKKPEEWEEYNAYCEQCKMEARLEVYGEEGG